MTSKSESLFEAYKARSRKFSGIDIPDEDFCFEDFCAGLSSGMVNNDIVKVADEYAGKILSQCTEEDSEIDHVTRDELMEDFLRKSGLDRLYDAYTRVEERHGCFGHK